MTPEVERESFQPFPGTDATTFIQWKGTIVCMDLHCQCGAHNHIDADFTYFIQCGACGLVYEMGTQVLARKVAVPAQEPVVGSIPFPPKDT